MTRILVIDSNLSTGFHLKKLLANYPVEIFSASSESEAIAKMHKQFDIVILDINLGGDDGFEVMQRINEHATTPLIIVATSTNTRRAFVRSIRLGASDYILKPYDENYIKGKLLKHIKELQSSNAVQSSENIDLLIKKHMETAVLNKTEMVIGAVIVYNNNNPMQEVTKNTLVKGFFSKLDKAVASSELLADSETHIGSTAQYGINGKVIIIDSVKFSNKEKVVQAVKRIADETLSTSVFSYEMEFLSLPQELKPNERVMDTLSKKIEENINI